MHAYVHSAVCQQLVPFLSSYDNRISILILNSTQKRINPVVFIQHWGFVLSTLSSMHLETSSPGLHARRSLEISLDQYTSFAKDPWGFSRPENRKEHNVLSKATFVEWPNTTSNFSLHRGVAPAGKLAANHKSRFVKLPPGSERVSSGHTENDH